MSNIIGGKLIPFLPPLAEDDHHEQIREIILLRPAMTSATAFTSEFFESENVPPK